MGQARARNWTPEEKTYLEDNWGSVSMRTLMAKLDRNKNAINIMVQRLGLGPFLDNGDYVSYSQLLMALFGIDDPRSAYRVNKSWLDFPVKYKRVHKNRFKVVYLDDFWEWAEENKRAIDFSKMEENILGAEPEWVKLKRKIDFECRTKASPWTKAEDLKLERMLLQHRYSYTDLSAEFNRTEDAIRRRIWDLALDAKPVRAKTRLWSQEEVAILVFMHDEGWSIEKIGQRLGRTGQSVRGKLGLLDNPDQYLRENRRKAVDSKIKI